VIEHFRCELRTLLEKYNMTLSVFTPDQDCQFPVEMFYCRDADDQLFILNENGGHLSALDLVR
jgi:hypothetical protein